MIIAAVQSELRRQEVLPAFTAPSMGNSYYRTGARLRVCGEPKKIDYYSLTKTIPAIIYSYHHHQISSSLAGVVPLSHQLQIIYSYHRHQSLHKSPGCPIRLLPAGALLLVSALNRIFTESSERPGKCVEIFFQQSPCLLCLLNKILSSSSV